MLESDKENIVFLMLSDEQQPFEVKWVISSTTIALALLYYTVAPVPVITYFFLSIAMNLLDLINYSNIQTNCMHRFSVIRNEFI